ncbi:MAG: hypothetical protein LUE29_01065 [Lachnospiraceae bacterium]|nr:hypothetical protein [Lachnospiraceae bacterium]
MMTLSESDAKLFYDLWKPLLDYTNARFHVNDLKDITHAESLEPEEVKKIANVLWDHVEAIDDYLESDGKGLSDEEKGIVSGWKRCVKGRFIIERHLKSGSILISMEDGRVYRVSGIISSWEEIFFYMDPPILIQATLLPFKDVIISDGLHMMYPVIIGGNMKRSFKDTYMEAKKGGMLYTKL